jgi:hypothetical protein
MRPFLASPLLFFFSLLFIFPKHCEAQPQWQWLESFGSTYNNETVYSTEVDSKGNIIAIALALDGSDFQNISYLKIRKYETGGKLLWEKEIHSGPKQIDLFGQVTILPGGLCVDSSDNIYLDVNTYDTALVFDTTVLSNPLRESFIFKLSPEGSLLWTKRIHMQNAGWVADEKTKLLAIDRHNDLIFTGSAISYPDSVFKIDGIPYFSVKRWSSLIIAKFDSSGRVLFAKLIDQSTREGNYYGSAGQYVNIDANNNIVILGFFCPNLVNFETELVARGGTDIFLGKFTTDGEITWIDRIGGKTKDFQAGFDLGLDEQGNAYIIGVVRDTVTITGWSGQDIPLNGDGPEILIAKFDQSGEVVWDRRVGGLDPGRLGTTFHDCPMSLCYSPQNQSVVCRSLFLSDAFIGTKLIKLKRGDGLPILWSYSLDGNLNWIFPIDIEDNYFQFNTLTSGHNNDIYLSGFVGSDPYVGDTLVHDVTIYPYTIHSTGGNDALLGKLSLSGLSRVTRNEIINEEAAVFPNPFSDKTTIVLPSQYSTEAVFLRLYNILGVKVLEEHVTPDDRTIVLERSGLASGVYHYQIQNESSAALRGEVVIE